MKKKISQNYHNILLPNNTLDLKEHILIADYYFCTYKGRSKSIRNFYSLSKPDKYFSEIV